MLWQPLRYVRKVESSRNRPLSLVYLSILGMIITFPWPICASPKKNVIFCWLAGLYVHLQKNPSHKVSTHPVGWLLRFDPVGHEIFYGLIRIINRWILVAPGFLDTNENGNSYLMIFSGTEFFGTPKMAKNGHCWSHTCVSQYGTSYPAEISSDIFGPIPRPQVWSPGAGVVDLHVDKFYKNHQLVGIIIVPIYGKIIQMFQTTNQSVCVCV